MEFSTSKVAEKPEFVKKALTNWKAFDQAGLALEYIRCDGYKPVHPYNNGCHTLLQPFLRCLVSHIDGEHQGGFQMKLNPTGLPSTLWKEFAEAGIESRDFRCNHCQQEVRLHPKKIMEHFRQHQGWLAKARPEGVFDITLSREAPLELTDEI